MTQPELSPGEGSKCYFSKSHSKGYLTPVFYVGNLK